MAELVLGPILRHVGLTEATVWVEADARCEVEIRESRSPTFQIEGRHYAIVIVRDLEPGQVHEYEVLLDGERRWPLPDSDFPPSVIRTTRGSAARVVFGSCRVALPNDPPYSLDKEDDPRGRGPDALYALALRMRERESEHWPDLLLMLGDQIYADEVSPDTLEFIRSRRDTDGPHGEEVADFEEYRHLYLDAWGEPTLRWLLSTVPTATIFDDHDVHDDWNTSLTWQRQVRSEPWWEEHIVNALGSYWVYQHLGNLSPAELEENELLSRIREMDDGGDVLREFARRADREPDSIRWSYTRDLGHTRLVVIDSRASRVLEPDSRSMLDAQEWEWLEEQLRGDCDHLLIATSLPFLLAPGLHDLEAWSEAVCDGAWGRLGLKFGEKMRERFDLEHWAAFRQSFLRLAGLVEDVAAGRRGKPPAAIMLLSGDVHHAYLAEVAFRRSAAAQSAVYQAVCSPMRNELDDRERAVVRFACSPPGHVLGHFLTNTARVPKPPIRWRLTEPQPWFDNQLAEIELDHREASIVFERAVNSDPNRPGLERIYSRALS